MMLKEQERSQAEWNRKARDAVNAISRRLCGAGGTSARPGMPVLGQMYFDSTLGKPVWWDGAGWKDAAGAAA